MLLTDSAAAEEEGRKKDEKGVKFSSQVSTKKDEEENQEVFVDERKLMYASCICMYVCTKNNQPALVISLPFPLSIQGTPFISPRPLGGRRSLRSSSGGGGHRQRGLLQRLASMPGKEGNDALCYTSIT